jgi:hypothetical protein
MLYSEAFVAAALIWATALLIEAARRADVARPRLVLAGFLLVVAGLTKITALVFAPAFVVGVLAHRGVPPRRRVQAAAVVAAGAAIALAVHLAWNVQRFGDPFEPGYNWAETVPVGPPRAFAVEDLPRGLAVMLVSPGKSLLLWAPPLALALWRGRRLWRTHRGLAAGLLTALASALVFYGSYLFPEGGYAHGPRHLVPLIPLLLLAGANPAAAAPGRRAVLVCATVGATLAALSVSVSFLEDQALGANPAVSSTAYYELIDPAPGRARNRYALGYLPFQRTFGTPGWLETDRVGAGPDYFPLHLEHVRRGIRGGTAIPSWFPPLLPVLGTILLVGTLISARRDSDGAR